jgi:hypothetical protein
VGFEANDSSRCRQNYSSTANGHADDARNAAGKMICFLVIYVFFLLAFSNADARSNALSNADGSPNDDRRVSNATSGHECSHSTYSAWFNR